MSDPKPRAEHVASIAAALSEREIRLLLGKQSHWGSWHSEVCADLWAKGLAQKSVGGYTFDTQLADAVRAHLLATV